MEYLSIILTGADQKFIVEQIFGTVARLECSIENCHIDKMTDVFSATILLGGSWSAIAKAESQLPALAKQFNVVMHIQRTKIPKLPDNELPYLAQIFASDNPKLYHSLSVFFTNHQITIRDIYLIRSLSSQTNARMVTLYFLLSIPTDKVNLADLREQFMLICDDLNIDGIIEPEKR